MRKVLCFLPFVAFITVLSFPALGQENRLGNIMQNTPPGAVTVLGRSVLGAVENGFGSSIALLIGADNQNVRQEIGMTDTEANSIRLLRMQILASAPLYANRFKTMTEADHEGIQRDLSREMGRIAETLNKALPPERMEKVKKLAFQTIGGLDSPVLTLDSMEVLNLSEDQRNRMQTVFSEVREERLAQMEAGLAMAEKVVAAGGPQNLSQEDREQLQREGEQLRDQSFATAKKLADRLRQHLTPEQLKLEKDLIASRPAFLPGLPSQLQRLGDIDEIDGIYIPGAGSWRPGRALPVPVQEQRGGNRRFPRSEEE